MEDFEARILSGKRIGNAPRFIGTAVVNQQGLKVHKCLLTNTFQTTRQIPAYIVDRDDNRYERPAALQKNYQI